MNVYLAYQDWFAAGEVDFTYTFFESVQVVPYFFTDSEILVAYLKDLGLGLLFAGLGVIYYLSLREKRMKKQQAAEAAAKAKEESMKETEEV